MSKEQRLAVISEIERKRNSKVITYITSDRGNFHQSIRPDVVRVIHEHILAIPEDERKKIDLFLYSRGGDSDTPWAIISMLREYVDSGELSVLIPYRCHSAATMIAIGADEIVMGKKSELGPIDITMTGPHNPKDPDNNSAPISVEDVMGYFSLQKRIGSLFTNKNIAFEKISSEISPLALGSVNRLLEQTRLAAKRLLQARKNNYSKTELKQIINTISSEIYSHNHAISRTEAIESVGLKHCVKAEDAEIDVELWQLYKLYRDYFKFDEPINPNAYLIENNLKEHIWKDVPVALVESSARMDVQSKTLKLVQVKNIPPEFSLNLQGLQIPSVNIPDLPQGITSQQLAALVEQIMTQVINQAVNTAAAAAAQQFANLLPVAGHERSEYFSPWNIV